MRKATLFLNVPNAKNFCFDFNSSKNRDNCFSSLILLKEFLQKNDIDLSTQDINSPENSEFVLFLDMPLQLPKARSKDKSFLLIFETEVVYPNNWKKENHEKFSKIFTWSDDLVDCRKYFKMNWTHSFPNVIEATSKNDRKLCTLVAANKCSSHRNELYSKRIEAIRWFEKFHPSDFDLYGFGWNERPSLIGMEPFFHKILRRIGYFQILKFVTPAFLSYRGSVIEKISVLKKYQFAICYENAQNYPGYITEKIFDCFFSGCVPIYWGPPNVQRHIPRNCFIDRQQFGTYDELYHFLVGIKDSEFCNYLQSAQRFLQSDHAFQFTSDFFVRELSREIFGIDSL